MFHEKGSTKEIEIADGALTLMCTCNPLELNIQERELVFALVDLIDIFKADRTEQSTP